MTQIYDNDNKAPEAHDKQSHAQACTGPCCLITLLLSYPHKLSFIRHINDTAVSQGHCNIITEM